MTQPVRTNNIEFEGPTRDLVNVEIRAMFHRINRKLNEIRKEVKKLENNDSALTQVVTDLVSAFTDNTTAVEAEIAAIQASTTPGDDPVVDTAITNLQALVANIKASTAAAQAAIAPAPATPAAPATTDTTTTAATTTEGTTGQ